MNTKYCRGCEADLPTGEFYRSSTSHFCRKCLTRKANEYRAANLDKCRAYSRRRRKTEEHRADAREYNRKRAAKKRAVLRTWDFITASSG